MVYFGMSDFIFWNYLFNLGVHSMKPLYAGPHFINTIRYANVSICSVHK